MSIHRARAFCPNCYTEEEVWYYNSTIQPISVIECTNCATIYDPSSFIHSFLELRQNVSISVSTGL